MAWDEVLGDWTPVDGAKPPHRSLSGSPHSQCPECGSHRRLFADGSVACPGCRGGEGQITPDEENQALVEAMRRERAARRLLGGAVATAMGWQGSRDLERRAIDATRSIAGGGAWRKAAIKVLYRQGFSGGQLNELGFGLGEVANVALEDRGLSARFAEHARPADIGKDGQLLTSDPKTWPEYYLGDGVTVRRHPRSNEVLVCSGVPAQWASLSLNDTSRSTPAMIALHAALNTVGQAQKELGPDGRNERNALKQQIADQAIRVAALEKQLAEITLAHATIAEELE